MTSASSTTAPTAPPVAPGRDLVLDAVRAGCLVVVVVWHCALSVLHRDGTGALSMPNPVGAHRGLWLLTWALQVMPLFFVVSGAANGPSWARARVAGTAARGWASRRAVRFATPLAVLGGACAAAEGLSHLVGAGPFLAQHLVVLVPLWTLGLLLAFAPLTPALEAAERRGWGPAVAVGLVAAVAAGDLLRFRFDIAAGGWVSTAAAWLFAYHLGWAYRRGGGGGPAAPPPPPPAPRGGGRAR
ncbi:MAG: acyltransferase family protein, partial [Acidimicrobiales bacterium]